MQSGEIIIETENVRFAKDWRFFQTFWEIFCKINNKSHQNVAYIDVWTGQSPFQSSIAAKPLEASGKAASLYI